MTELTKIGIRYYDPTLGRFTQPDPTGQDPHYTYARNNPCNYTDPSGAISTGCALALGLTAVSTVGFAASLASIPVTGGLSATAAISLGTSLIGKYGGIASLPSSCP